MAKAVTTVFLKVNGQVTIPKKIRDQLRLEIGDQLKLSIEKFPPDPEQK